MIGPGNYKHSLEETITLAHDGDEISVWPSEEAPGSVAIALMDSDEPRTNVGTATPAEWDAFVAAGNAALGRPAPVATPLEERILRAWDKAKNESETHANRERAVYCDGQAQGLRAALAMVREAGPTVPRAALSDRNISELRAIVGTSPNDTFDQCVREIEALIARIKTEREMGAQWERDEIENMIGADTSPGVLAVADRLIVMVRARSGEAAREQGATVPRSAVEALRKVWQEYSAAPKLVDTEWAIADLDDLLAASTAPTEKG